MVKGWAGSVGTTRAHGISSISATDSSVAVQARLELASACGHAGAGDDGASSLTAAAGAGPIPDDP